MADSSVIASGPAPFSRQRFWALIAVDAPFRERFVGLLTDAPYDAFCFETPPLSPALADLPFEYAIIDSPALAAVQADPRPFTEPFRHPGGSVVVFPNLGGDAILVAPRPEAAPGAAHLAAFLRSAPRDVIDALFQATARAVVLRMAERLDPFWVSTAGLGVSWLHVRIDDSPKYYRHLTFATR